MRRSSRTTWIAAGAAVAVAGIWGGATPASAQSADRQHVVRHTSAEVLRARLVDRADSRAVVANGLPGTTVSVVDPEDDNFLYLGSGLQSTTAGDPHGDLVLATSTYGSTSLTMTVKAKVPEDPRTSANWKRTFPTDSPLGSFASWYLDTDNDDEPDYMLEAGVDGVGFYGASFYVKPVMSNGDPSQTCEATPSYSNGTVSVTVAAVCIGSPKSFKWYAGLDYNTDNKSTTQSFDDGPNAPGWAISTAPVAGLGVLEVDRSGGMHGAGTNTLRRTSGGGWWPNQDIVRGLAMLPDQTGAYELDLFGGFHEMAFNGAALPTRVRGGLWAPGRDVARGAVVLPSGTGGYIVDLHGQFYPFAVGNNPMPPAITDGPRWRTGDIVRGVTLTPDGRGGYVVDLYGGLHAFSVVPGGKPTARLSGGPYWVGLDIVRGVRMLPDGSGGLILDKQGVTHGFSVNGGPIPPKPKGLPWWPGQDITRDLLVTSQ